VARFGKEHVEPYVHEMEEAGGFKPELMKAIFDQGVSGYFPLTLFDACILLNSGWVLKFLRTMEAVVLIFFHVYWRLRKLQK
jgi:hypothetical protein